MTSHMHNRIHVAYKDKKTYYANVYFPVPNMDDAIEAVEDTIMDKQSRKLKTVWGISMTPMTEISS